MTHEIVPQTPGVADHAAKRSDAKDRAWRTALQGLALDVLLAVALVVHDATSTTADTIDWRLLLLTVVKTALMTAAAYVMRRVKPPAA